MVDSFVCAPYPVPLNEERRIRVLQECNLLDSSTYEVDFDRFTSLARRIFHVPIALVSLVDVDRQWFKSNMGLTVFETGRDVSFCAHAIVEESEDIFIVPDATKDERFCNNPLVTGPPHIRFYAGGTINVDDCKLGSFCIIDSQPRTDFTLNDKMNLMDLTEAVSCLIRQRRDTHLKSLESKEFNFENLIRDIKLPLDDLNKSFLQLHDNKDSTNVEVEEGQKILTNLESCLSNLNNLVDTKIQRFQNTLKTAVSDPNLLEPMMPMDLNKSKGGSFSVPSSPRSKKVTPTSAHSGAQGNNHVKIKVLLMEDSIPTQKIISRWFVSHGCEITVADNGMIGLIHLKTEKFDIALVDFLMPVMDGVECVKEYAHWRKDNKTDDTVVYNSNMLIIGMSSTASSAEQAQAFKNGMHAFTSKPIDMTILQLAVNLKKNKTDLMACSDALHSHFSCGFIFEDADSGKSPTISRLNSDEDSTVADGQDKDRVGNGADTKKKPKVKKSFFGKWSFTQGSGGSKSKIFPK